MKTIAFYLPQYHPIPENDQWWGKGFTEWTNVAKARPRFPGHYQPHIPADLGFYDLRNEETRIAQAKLALEYGIGGFCYYHYWFNGKMLLERPLNEVRSSGKPDFPFCICWANENWTRRWDGQEHEILMKQDYDNYNAEEHMIWLTNMFLDKRYIKIHDKPLFLIYRAGDIPDIEQKVKIWQRVARQKGFPGLYLVYIKNFATTIKDNVFLEMGFNAVLEFEPGLKHVPLKQVFRANLYNYKDIVKKNLGKPIPNFINFPCVFPSWDNSPRKKFNASIVQNLDPELYKTWLKEAFHRVQDYDFEEQIVFINAWNEWGEGCHLEPDLKNGRMFLEATKQALDEYNRNDNFRVLFEKGTWGHTNDWESLVSKISQFRPVFIWGAGEGGQETYENLKKAGIRISGFIDSNSAKWNNKIQGIPIVGPSVLKDTQELLKRPFVIVASVYSVEITGYLQEYKYYPLVDYVVDSRIAPKKSDNGLIIQENGINVNCNICGGEDFITVLNKENTDYKCVNCGSNSQERMAVQTLFQQTVAKDINNLKLLEVSGRLPASILGTLLDFHCSYYAPKYFEHLNGFIQGETFDLTLHYENNKFDVVIALEYQDHPFYNQTGYSEILRILKSGGCFILVLESCKKNQMLFSNEYLREMFIALNSIGFEVGFIQTDYLMYAIESHPVFVCKKK